MFVFFHIFPFLWEFNFPVFWEFYGFLLQPKYLRNFGMFVFFPYFSSIMRIRFSHVLGIVWISASSRIFKKPINLKCLSFPILFRYNGNSLFQCLGTAWISASSKNNWETHKFEMFVFFHAFPVHWKSTFPIFWELHGFLLQVKHFRNT